MDEAETVAALKVENARLRVALRHALMLEKFWRIRALLGPLPPEPETRRRGEGPRAMRQRDEPRP